MDVDVIAKGAKLGLMYKPFTSSFEVMFMFKKFPVERSTISFVMNGSFLSWPHHKCQSERFRRSARLSFGPTIYFTGILIEKARERTTR